MVRLFEVVCVRVLVPVPVFPMLRLNALALAIPLIVTTRFAASFCSMKAPSAEVGMLAPPAPPEVVLQLLGMPFQSPVTTELTQKRAARATGGGAAVTPAAAPAAITTS